MEAFTGIDTGIVPTAAAMTSSTNPTTIPASVPNENAAFTATITTPLSSPEKHDSPSTPDQTLLRQRFLRAVSMSPAIPSRPSMEGRKTSGKARDSPILVRRTPQKTNQPPMKLEVGQGAFYFSIELPPNKITSKKSGTKSKSGTPKGGETPTRTRTPSPLKNASPTKEDAAGTPSGTTRSPLKRRETIHQSPARPLFGTPTKMMTPKQTTDPQTPIRRTPSPRKTYSSVKRSPARISAETPKRRILGETPGSNQPERPVKRSVEQDDSPMNPTETSSLLAKKVRSEPKEISGKPIAGLIDLNDEHAPNANLIATTATTSTSPHPGSTRQAPTVKASPENIGQLMASLIGNTTSTHGWASSHDNDMMSPVPTPLRKAGEKLKLGESPSFLRMSANGTTATTNEDPAADSIKIGSLTPREPASTEPGQDASKPSKCLPPKSPEEVPSSSITQDQITKLDCSRNISQESRPALSLCASSPGSLSTLNTTRKAQAPLSRPLLFSKQSLEMNRDEPRSFLPVPTGQQRRVSTDPGVLLKIQKDMTNFEATMRHSAGGVDQDFCGPLNLNELPAIADDHSVRDHQDIRNSGTAGTLQSFSQANSGNSSLEAVQANVGKSARSIATPRVSGVPRTPQWKPSDPTPAQVNGDRLVAAKRKDSHQSTGADRMISLGRPRPRAGSAVSGSEKLSVMTSTPRRKTLATPDTPTVPSEATSLSSPCSRIPSLTSTKAKSTTQLVPHIARRPLPSKSGSGKVVAALKERLPNVPSGPINPRPVPTRKPLDSSATKPYNPSADQRPYEQKFASASDIADRLAGWHNEDRKKAEVSRPTVPTRPINKTSARTPLRAQPTESTTPHGFPNKSLTPLTVIPAPTKPLSPTKDTKSRLHSTVPSTPRSKPSAPPPKTPAPKTPALATHKSAVNDLRQPITAGAKTPVNRRIPAHDRNATRTPSKDIVSSLDAAIDRKIAEDARSGLEFTPGGNRLRDLLDARDGEVSE